MISSEVISEIRNRIDIVKVVGRHVELKKKGQNHFGLCPFHSEKTSSFSVHPGKQIFHCFGCGETGDVFAFLGRVEGRPFYEIAHALALEAGVTIPDVHRTPEAERRAREHQSDRERALSLNDRVANFYREQLLGASGKPAREYLRNRGIGEAISERFRLGYAPDGWTTLLDFLVREKISLPLAERLGLVIARRDASGFYDRFRGRVLFPLIGPAGEVLGFGGRILEDKPDEPKYLNTPETAVYHKGEALYGLHAARRAISQQGVAIVVEGNFDVLALHEAGLDSAVAPMGTALTERQVLLLKRFARQAVAMFDGDKAGRAAAERSVPIFLSADVDARVALLPQGEDPDTVVRKQGRPAIERCIKAARPAMDHVLQEALAVMERTIPGRVRALEEVASVLWRVPNDTIRELYVAQVAETLKIDISRVQAAVREAQKGAQKSDPKKTQAQPEAQTTPIPEPEKRLFGLVVDHPTLCTQVVAEGLLGMLRHEGLRQVLARLCDMQARGDVDWGQLVTEAPQEIRADIEHEVFAGGFAECEDPNRAFGELLAWLRATRLGEEAGGIRENARAASARGEEETVRNQVLIAIEMDRKRRELLNKTR